MIKPDVDPVSFGYKHGIAPHKNHCRKCGVEVDVSIPIISPEFVGFESAEHECGRQYVIIELKPRKYELTLEGIDASTDIEESE